MRMDKERREFLKKELKEYEEITPMTKPERKALHEWVDAGYSVHENSACAVYEGGIPLDFLTVYRDEEEIRRATVGMSSEEARKYALAYYGWDEPEPKEVYTMDSLKNRIRKLERELFYVWDFIGQEGFWNEASEYVNEHRDEPIPFEIE